MLDSGPCTDQEQKTAYEWFEWRYKQIVVFWLIGWMTTFTFYLAQNNRFPGFPLCFFLANAIGSSL